MDIQDFIQEQERRAQDIAAEALRLAADGHYALAETRFSEAVEVIRMVRNVKKEAAL